MTNPKVSFIVPARNKAKYVAKTVESVLAQTYSPMEIVLSDQGSTDGTFEIMKELAEKYSGPNTVRVLQCPHTEYKGMAGLNWHLNWIHDQIEGDLVIMCSADDLNHPQRAEFTVKAFIEHNPSYIGTCVQYHEEDGTCNSVTSFHENGWITPVENLDNLMGSSASSAWARDLYTKYGPLRMVESQDLLLPFFATLERGIWYINEQLHAYVKHADENNTGLEGVLRAAQTDEEKHILTETCNWHYTSNWFAIFRRCQEMQINLTQEVQDALIRKCMEGGNIWSMARDNVTMLRLQPRAMKV